MKPEQILSPEAIDTLSKCSSLLKHIHVPALLERVEVLQDDWAELIYLVLKRAEEMHSHPSADLVDVIKGVDYFVHGWFRTTPKAWKEWSKELNDQKDPEWDEYVRLRDKFGRKD